MSKVTLILFLLGTLSFPASLCANSADIENPDSKSMLIQPAFGDLDAIFNRGILRILVTHSQTDFFFDKGQIRGMQVEIVRAFLAQLNAGRTNRSHASEANRIFPQYVPVAFNELIPSLLAGEGDIAAAFLTVTPEREALVDFVIPLGRNIAEIVVSHQNAPAINRLADLAGKKVYVLRSSSYAQHLELLNQQFETVDLPPIEIIEADAQLLTEDILELVNAGIVDYTICDDFKAQLWQKVLPDIRLHLKARVSENQFAGWAIRPGSPQLLAALNEFSSNVKKGSLMGNILFNKYYASTRWIDNPLSTADRDKLQKLVHLFLKYGNQYQFDPLALAAQAYQESRFNQEIRSHRGAIGVMQVLPSTASDPNVAIEDISSLNNNIHAGTKYLDFLRKRYFSGEGIDPINQRLFSWAAYNAGPANIIRIRRAARENGLDPNVWFGNVEHMAAKMISREPVQYVANVYKYYTAYRLVERQSPASIFNAVHSNEPERH